MGRSPARRATGLLLCLPVAGGGRRGLDVRVPSRLLGIGPDAEPGAEAAGAILVEDRPLDDVATRPDGGLTIGRALLWCLLDPRRTLGAERPEDPDEIAGERWLRLEARHLWSRLPWWGGLEPAVTAACRAALGAALPAALPLPDLLDRLAGEGASPFDGWSAGAGAGEAGPAAGEGDDGAGGEGGAAATPPAEPGDLERWMLAADGLGALFGAGFAPRQEQADVAAAVAAALAQERALLVEAGTGIGKTLAYLVPLVLAARRRGERAVVSTHTRALQAQILEQDLPRLRRLLPDLAAALLMGRSNYLCRQARDRFLARQASAPLMALAQAALRLYLADTREGLREELERHPLLRRHLRELFDSQRPCSPATCHGGACFVQQARRRAREAELLLVNHSLLLHDRRAEGTLLGPYGLLVIDEAHRLPAVALEVHAIRLAPDRLDPLPEVLGGVPAAGSAVLTRLRRGLLGAGGEAAAAAELLPDLAAALDGCQVAHGIWWRELEAAWEERLPAAVREGARLRIRDAQEAFTPVAGATGRLLERCGAVAAAVSLLAGKVERLAEPTAALEEDLADVAQAGQIVAGLERDVRFLTGGPGEDWVVWLEAAGGLPASIAATPLQSGPLLREAWLERGLAPVASSATLAVGEDFGHMIGELGLARRSPPARTFLAPSPFDHERQALMLATTGLPAPDAAAFPAAVAEVLRELRRRIPRRTLVLFTSYQMLREVAADLTREPADAGLFEGPSEAAPAGPVLVQSPRGGAAALARRFRRARAATLLGTASFWEGVDFPGSDLEILVVVKLPFQVPTDPWVEARCERLQALGEDPFTSFMVRDAVLRLRQGVGRLIRSPEDRGVFVLLDGRLHSRPYGLTFARSLPAPLRPCRDATEVATRAAAFLRGESDAGAGGGEAGA